MTPKQPVAGFSHIPLADWASLHAHLMWIYDGPVDSHGHGVTTAYDLTAWLLRRGSVEVRSGAQRWHARAGEWLFPPAGERWQSFSADARIVSVRFRAKWPTGEDFFKEGLGLKLAGGRHPQLLHTAQPLARFVSRHFPETTIDLMQVPASLEIYLRLQTLFSRWFETVVAVLTAQGVEPSRMGKIDPRLSRAVRSLDRRALSTPISETEVAVTANLSVSQLNRLFVRQFGTSSRGYFERRRHQHAMALLQQSSEGVKQIAYHLGFSSLPHFSAWFRRQQGMSPRMFRTASETPHPADGKKT